jgi:hypothetical protein
VAAGVDEVTCESYGQELEANLHDLQERVQRGAYRAKPTRRVCIPKADGRLRPLGIAALEDKIVQRATVKVLNAIYEADFLGFSYGFRPGRGPHDALVARGRNRTREGELGARRGHPRLLHQPASSLAAEVPRAPDRGQAGRLIQKWLRAGAVGDGVWSASEDGSPRGATVSPLLANVYLLYVFDLWAPTTPLAHRSTGTLARERGAGTPRLLRRARQHPPIRGLPRPARAALVSGATAPRPATPPQLAADAPPRGAMAPSRPHHALLARSAIRRPHPSQQPSALVAHAGICAGAARRGSLPR